MHFILAASSDPFAVENNPVVRWLMLFASVGGAILVIRGLRRTPSWMLLATGAKATATVAGIEVRGVSGERRPLRRPSVSFTTADGRQVTTTPAFYRPRYGKVAGEAVEIRYDARDPQRVAVVGFDFRATELLSVGLWFLVTVVTASWSFMH